LILEIWQRKKGGHDHVRPFFTTNSGKDVQKTLVNFLIDIGATRNVLQMFSDLMLSLFGFSYFRHSSFPQDTHIWSLVIFALVSILFRF
jgi:hypothetical protein